MISSRNQDAKQKKPESTRTLFFNQHLRYRCFVDLISLEYHVSFPIFFWMWRSFGKKSILKDIKVERGLPLSQSVTGRYEWSWVFFYRFVSTLTVNFFLSVAVCFPTQKSKRHQASKEIIFPPPHGQRVNEKESNRIDFVLSFISNATIQRAAHGEETRGGKADKKVKCCPLRSNALRKKNSYLYRSLLGLTSVPQHTSFEVPGGGKWQIRYHAVCDPEGGLSKLSYLDGWPGQSGSASFWIFRSPVERAQVLLFLMPASLVSLDPLLYGHFCLNLNQTHKTEPKYIS